MSDRNRTLTAVRGLRVGHASDRVGATGCTVILAEQGAVGAACVRGAGVASRQILPLSPGHVSPEVHGVLLTGGSAFGLDATGGVLRYLEERGVGLATPATVVPTVPTFVIYDLGVGDATARPGPEMGRAACEAASSAPLEEGSVGAGTGATVGKLRGAGWAVKAGVGTWAETTPEGLAAAALVVLNAFGDICDPDTGRILAGARVDGGFLDARRAIMDGALERGLPFQQNTTLAVVATNARLSQQEVHRAAALAANALPRCIRPVHTLVDGDVVVGLATGERAAELHRVGLLWEEALTRAVLRAVSEAEGLHGVPALRDLPAPRGSS